MKFSIIASKQDEAGMNIAGALEKLDFQINYVDCDIVYAENIDKQLDKDIDFIIFISKHQGKNPKMLSIHAPGNFSSADFGGIPGKVCKTSAFILKTFFINLNKNKEDWQATMEVTHHGPYINKPCLFIEIGSSQQDWKSVEAAKAIAKTIQESIEQINKGKLATWNPAIGIASPHYCPNFNKIQLSQKSKISDDCQNSKRILKNSKYALSHIIPSYVAPITLAMLQEAILKTQEPVQLAILNWKSLKGEERQEVTKIANQLNLKILRTSEIEKN